MGMCARTTVQQYEEFKHRLVMQARGIEEAKKIDDERQKALRAANGWVSKHTSKPNVNRHVPHTQATCFSSHLELIFTARLGLRDHTNAKLHRYVSVIGTIWPARDHPPKTWDTPGVHNANYLEIDKASPGPPGQTTQTTADGEAVLPPTGDLNSATTATSDIPGLAPWVQGASPHKSLVVAPAPTSGVAGSGSGWFGWLWGGAGGGSSGGETNSGGS
jgi:hypothetical protein